MVTSAVSRLGHFSGCRNRPARRRAAFLPLTTLGCKKSGRRAEEPQKCPVSGEARGKRSAHAPPGLHDAPRPGFSLRTVLSSRLGHVVVTAV